MSTIESLATDFDLEQIGEWAYPSPEKGLLPYARGVGYFAEGLDIQGLAKRNMDEARKARLTDTGYSLTKDGLYVGLVFWNGSEQIRPKFEPPVPLDDALSGDQPPITGFYPRVVLPAEGEYGYAVLFCYDDGIFGTKFESHKITVPEYVTACDVIPHNVPFRDGVRSALRDFFPNETFLPQGDYTLNMEIEQLPVLAVRIDGCRPLVSELMYEGEIKLELPIMDQPKFSGLEFIYPNRIKSVHAPKANPFRRRVFNEKYFEVPFALPSGEPEQWFPMRSMSLEYQGKKDTADLTYVALRRHESVAETKVNPHLGLVEVQVTRALKLLSVNIDYQPREVQQPDWQTTKKGGYARIPAFQSVSTGKTVLRNPKTGRVSPKIEAEFDCHLTTFRFCMTNEIT